MNGRRQTNQIPKYSLAPGESKREQRRKQQEAIEAGIRARREKPKVSSRFTGNVSNGTIKSIETAKHKSWEDELETYIFTVYKKDPNAFYKALKFRVKKILNQCHEFRYAVYFPKEIFPKTEGESEKTRKERESAKNKIVIYTITMHEKEILERWTLTLPEDWINIKNSFPNILQLTGEVTQSDVIPEELVELQFKNYPE